ncbi:MAG: type II toxin-antitoxin system VapC family toxin, partial [Nitrospirae bacterium]|nr:type II toxin-antitoxin system VapC family toxin [Nitrospirota bacterium]
MKTIVFDSHPLLAYFEKEEGWERIAELFQEGVEGKYQILFSVVNWGEVYYAVLREYGEKEAIQIMEAIKNMPIDLVDVTKEHALYAARLKAKGGISYADCFAAGLAQLKKAEVLTGDKEFRRVE